MGNIKKKQQQKLKLRQQDFDDTGLGRKPGFKRPGSQNRHKQQTAGATLKGKRR